MRVVMVAFGFIEYCASLATALSRRARVTLFLPDVDRDPVADLVGSEVDLRLYSQPRLRRPVASLRLTARIMRDVRRSKADIVHVQAGNLYFNSLIPLLGERALVVTAHDPRPHLGDRLSRKTPQTVLDFGLRRADALIVHGEALRRTAVAECGVRPDRVFVVPHHWDSGPPDAPVHDHDARPPSVLFFGRIWPYKGLEYLIRAQPRISAEVPEAQFVVAGEGEDMARYRAMMAQPERFTVHNTFIPRPLRTRLLERASVVALPYVEATQSGVIPLAWAHARPVVATRVGAIPEMVDDGRTGLLVPPRDAEALAAALVRVLRDSALGDALGRAGRERLRSELSPEFAAERTAAVYRAALAARGVGG